MPVDAMLGTGCVPAHLNAHSSSQVRPLNDLSFVGWLVGWLVVCNFVSAEFPEPLTVLFVICETLQLPNITGHAFGLLAETQALVVDTAIRYIVCKATQPTESQCMRACTKHVTS